MAEQWDGRPERPEVGNTWHWVLHANGEIVPRWWSCSYWQAVGGVGGNVYPHEAAKAWPRYCGRALTPAEVAAEVARAVAAEREACAERGERIGGLYGAGVAEAVSGAIRARGGTDALAEVRAHARQEGLKDLLGGRLPESAATCLDLTANELRAQGYSDSADLHAAIAAAIRALIEEPSNDA